MGLFGRWLVAVGLVLVVVGAILVVGQRFLPARLPGDFIWRKKGFTLYVPLASSLLLSVVLTLLLNLFFRRR